MKQHACSALCCLIALTCLGTYAFVQQNGGGALHSTVHRTDASDAARTELVLDSLPGGASESAHPSSLARVESHRAVAHRSQESIQRSKPRPSAQPSVKPSAEVETADSTAAPQSVGGGGEVTLPTVNSCAPDSYVVQTCSFEDWTYIFPQD
jgi:hypothetical protein